MSWDVKACGAIQYGPADIDRAIVGLLHVFAVDVLFAMVTIFLVTELEAKVVDL